MSWNGFGVDSHFNFERKLKMMLHLLRILALTFCSKFQLIQNWFFFERKFNYLQLFQKYRKPNFNVFQAKNAFQIAAENNNVFWAFLNFFIGCICFSIQFIFQKKFLLKLREGISLLDKLEQIWCWSPFEILRENWR